jgi:hypothetical protein
VAGSSIFGWQKIQFFSVAGNSNFFGWREIATPETRVVYLTVAAAKEGKEGVGFVEVQHRRQVVRVQRPEVEGPRAVRRLERLGPWGRSHESVSGRNLRTKRI